MDRLTGWCSDEVSIRLQLWVGGKALDTANIDVVPGESLIDNLSFNHEYGRACLNESTMKLYLGIAFIMRIVMAVVRSSTLLYWHKYSSSPCSFRLIDEVVPGLADISTDSNIFDHDGSVGTVVASEIQARLRTFATRITLVTSTGGRLIMMFSRSSYVSKTAIAAIARLIIAVFELVMGFG